MSSIFFFFFIIFFYFRLSYRSGSKNEKPEALSRIHSSEPASENPNSVLPNACVLGAVQWDVEQRVLQAQGSEPTPEGCPPNRLHVSVDLQSSVLKWAHSSPISCHPGVRRTLFHAQQWFWWPTMNKDIQDFVATCPICAVPWIPPKLPLDYFSHSRLQGDHGYISP